MLLKKHTTYVAKFQEDWISYTHIACNNLVIIASTADRTNHTSVSTHPAFPNDTECVSLGMHFDINQAHGGVLCFIVTQKLTETLHSYRFTNIDNLRRDVYDRLRVISIIGTLAPFKLPRLQKLGNNNIIAHIKDTLRYRKRDRRDGQVNPDLSPIANTQDPAKASSNKAFTAQRVNDRHNRRNKHAKKLRRTIKNTKCHNVLLSNRLPPEKRHNAHTPEGDRLLKLEQTQVSTENIIVMGVNMRGMRHEDEQHDSMIKLETVCDLLLDGRAHIICASETKINNSNLPMIKSIMNQKGISFRTSYIDDRASRGAMILWKTADFPLIIGETYDHFRDSDGMDVVMVPTRRIGTMVGCEGGGFVRTNHYMVPETPNWREFINS